jgi:hypothetical protein
MCVSLTRSSLWKVGDLLYPDVETSSSARSLAGRAHPAHVAPNRWKPARFTLAQVFHRQHHQTDKMASVAEQPNTIFSAHSKEHYTQVLPPPLARPPVVALLLRQLAHIQTLSCFFPGANATSYLATLIAAKGSAGHEFLFRGTGGSGSTARGSCLRSILCAVR